MKEVSEEMQFRIFDLLEGNLSEKESVSLMNEIEKSEALKREFELMARTYLPKDETIIFPGKERLLKKGGMRVLFAPMRYAAALFVVLLTGWILWQQDESSETRSFENRNAVTPNISEKNYPAVQEKKESVNPAAEKTFKKHFNAPLPEILTLKTTIDSANTKEKTTAVYAESPVPEKAEIQTIASVAIPDTGIAVTMPVPHAKKRSLTYKLLHSTKIMLAQLQVPDVQVSTTKVKNRTIPKFTVTIKTADVDFIATLIE